MCDDLFRKIDGEKLTSPTKKIVVETMFFEIYNEKVRDLYNKAAKSDSYDAPRIRQHPTREGLVMLEWLGHDPVLGWYRQKSLSLPRQMLGETAKAEEEYGALASYYAGPEARYHYAQMLIRLDRTGEARTLLEQIEAYARRAPRHYRNLHQHWLNLTRQTLKALDTPERKQA